MSNLSSTNVTPIAINRLQKSSQQKKNEANLWSEPEARKKRKILIEKTYRHIHLNLRSLK